MLQLMQFPPELSIVSKSGSLPILAISRRDSHVALGLCPCSCKGSPTPKVPVLETPAMLLGSLIRSCMTAKTRNSYQVSYSPRDNTCQPRDLRRPLTATDPQPRTLQWYVMELGTQSPGY